MNQLDRIEAEQIDRFLFPASEAERLEAMIELRNVKYMRANLLNPGPNADFCIEGSRRAGFFED